MAYAQSGLLTEASRTPSHASCVRFLSQTSWNLTLNTFVTIKANASISGRTAISATSFTLIKLLLHGSFILFFIRNLPLFLAKRENGRWRFYLHKECFFIHNLEIMRPIKMYNFIIKFPFKRHSDEEFWDDYPIPQHLLETSTEESESDDHDAVTPPFSSYEWWNSSSASIIAYIQSESYTLL